jgi:hypothetical protein
MLHEYPILQLTIIVMIMESLVKTIINKRHLIILFVEYQAYSSQSQPYLQSEFNS